MVITVMIEGCITGIAFSQMHRPAFDPKTKSLGLVTALMLFSLILYPLYDARKQSAQIPKFNSLAISWDIRDAEIRAYRQVGLLDVLVKGLNPPGGLSGINVDSHNWVNQCAAQFYDIRSISAINP